MLGKKLSVIKIYRNIPNDPNVVVILCYMITKNDNQKQYLTALVLDLISVKACKELGVHFMISMLI